MNMLTQESDKNAETITHELEWLAELIDTRFKLYFNNESLYEDIREIPLPDVQSSGSFYARVVREFSMEERLLLILALTPYIKPQLLDIFFAKNATYDRGFTEFGGVKGRAHTGFIPTAETALFLLAGVDVAKRLRAQHFIQHSVLFRSDILELSDSKEGEPPMSAKLSCTEEFLLRITGEPVQDKRYGSSFPARKIHTELNWEDLVLDPDVLEEINGIKTWIEHGAEMIERNPVMKERLGKGLSCFFYGAPGTGKTLAACLLGKATGCDVYRVDLAMAVSKYIGETEKNLERLFVAAEQRNWILFFDEADALFGKRTNVGSSNDRYANQEVSYLLQRIEAFPGVVILSANLKANIDDAFMRRFASVIHFPMPGHAERLRLWRNVFGAGDMLGEDVDLEAIAKEYELSGGAIVNVLRYCMITTISESKKQVTQQDIIKGIRKEFEKNGKEV